MSLIEIPVALVAHANAILRGDAARDREAKSPRGDSIALCAKRFFASLSRELADHWTSSGRNLYYAGADGSYLTRLEFSILMKNSKRFCHNKQDLKFFKRKKRRILATNSCPRNWRRGAGLRNRGAARKISSNNRHNGKYTFA